MRQGGLMITATGFDALDCAARIGGQQRALLLRKEGKMNRAAVVIALCGLMMGCAAVKPPVAPIPPGAVTINTANLENWRSQIVLPQVPDPPRVVRHTAESFVNK